MVFGLPDLFRITKEASLFEIPLGLPIVLGFKRNRAYAKTSFVSSVTTGRKDPSCQASWAERLAARVRVRSRMDLFQSLGFQSNVRLLSGSLPPVMPISSP